MLGSQLPLKSFGHPIDLNPKPASSLVDFIRHLKMKGPNRLFIYHFPKGEGEFRPS